jgi:hypothetical protein
MAKQANPRKIKSNRTYSFEEAAHALSVAVVTVRGWEKQGLRVLKSQRPYLMMGQDIREFLEAKNRKRRRPMRQDQFYCLGCRRSQTPLGAMADFYQTTPRTGRLVALCPTCESEVHRFVGLRELPKFKEILEIAIRDDVSA